MSEVATAPAPQQSASQISENIGDVLASIRKLIAQDEGTLIPVAAQSPVGTVERTGAGDLPRLAGAGGEAAISLRRVRSEAVAAQRRDILAATQTLNRRNDDGFFGSRGVSEAAPTTALPERKALSTSDFHSSAPVALPLSSADLVMGHSAQIGTSGAGTLGWGGEEAPLVLSGPLPPLTTAPAAGLGGPADGQGPEAQRLRSGSEVAPIQDAAAEQPKALDPVQDVLGARPLSTGDVQGGPQVSPSALPASTALPPCAAATGPHSPLPETEMIPSSIPLDQPVANSPVQPGAATTHSLEAARDDFATSILSTLIRDVVRNELQEAGMAHDLRAMILREVAQALTGGDRAR